MSKRPGLAYGLVERIATKYEGASGQAALKALGGIPKTEVRIERRVYRVGRYLRNKVLERMGISAEERQAHANRIVDQAFSERAGKSARTLALERKTRTEQEAGKLIYYQGRRKL